MSRVTSSVGLFSGINSSQIIEQLLSLQSRPKTTAQSRIGGYQRVQAAYLDVSSKTSALRTLAQSFRTKQVFRSARATSANEAVVTATATAGAPAGQYSVTVGRLASAQQVMSRGFADSTVSALGVSQVVVEDARGRMDSDTALSDLNGGTGVQRGRLVVTDSTGARTTVDLTRATTLNDVLTAVNDAGQNKFRIAINNSGDGLTVTDTAGGAGQITIASEGQVTTAADLGISASGAGSIGGSRIYRIGAGTRLSSLNDGLGVYISNTVGTGRHDFVISDRNGTNYQVNIGDIYDIDGNRTGVAATTVGDVINRINAATGGAVVAEVVPDGNPNGGSAIRLRDTTGGAGALKVSENGGTTAAELGILGSVGANTLNGTRLQSQLNTVSMTRLLGGTTMAPDTVRVRTRDGSTTFVNVDADAVTGSVREFVSAFNAQSSGRFSLAVDSTGTRFSLTDLTTGGNDFSTDGSIAQALGLQQDPTTGSSILGDRTQRQWIGRNTLLSDLNGRRGLGEGRFEIVGANGTVASVNVTSSTRTVGELLTVVNSALTNTDTLARLNDTGDGIVIESSSGSAATPIAIRDLTGTVARNLNLVGTSTGTGLSNRIDGSYERVITVSASDNLTQVSEKINSAGVGLLASVINDGSANPFRLSLTSRASGAAGALTIDTGSVSLGLSTVAQARNALMFYGSDDPTRALAIESTSNSVTNAIPGVTVNLLSASATPTSVSVTADNDKIVEEVGKFVEAFNALLNSIDSRSKYDSTTSTRGILLGDSTSQELRRSVLSLVQRKGQGVNSQYQFLFEVGVQQGSDGKLELKEDKLRAALERDPQGVADLFAGRVQAANDTTRDILDSNGVVIGQVRENVAGDITTRGVLEILADELELYTRSVDGKLARRNKLLDDQIKSQNARITAVDKKLESRRAILQRQFTAMETTIGRLQGQSSSLNSLSSISFS